MAGDRATERRGVGASIEWLEWSDSFEQLGVALSGGTDATVNGAIGSSVTDRVPLRWKDRFIFALGAEYQIAEEWTGRLGWRYGESPIPESLVTPLNGAILEHTLACGLEWRRGNWRTNLAYFYQFGDSAEVPVSAYRAGEYSQSRLSLATHSLAVSIARRF